MTLRDNTESPETIKPGTNELLGTNSKSIKPALEKLFRGEWKKEQHSKTVGRKNCNQDYSSFVDLARTFFIFFKQ